MMQIKLMFINVIFYRVCHSLTACQRYTPSSLAAVIGRCRLSMSIYAIMTLLYFVPYVSTLPYVRYVPCVACVALDGNPA